MPDKEIRCCLNCIFYKPDEKIQCKPFAKILKWKRDFMEIDSPYSIKCTAYKEQK